ncbi:MAG: glycosyltransferase family 2 protein [Luteolibacter sp.]|uniref:glycosyltransferase family 2 protein n=1 Tax=Luteolibacter sp. TaxID=1962973 RepID=UPI0032658AAB
MDVPVPQLLVVMPVFNEQDSVETVVTAWFGELDENLAEFTLLVIDDGSTDATPEILRDLRSKHGPRLECIHRPNRGHGQTCVQGYRIAVDRGIPFVMQIDSDGQSDPRYFSKFWALRNDFDVIYGKRLRQDGLRRIIASLVLRGLLRLFAGVDCVDANVPYRLMDTATCAEVFRSIPEDLFLANVGLAVMLRKNRMIRHGVVPIGFPPRSGGEPSVPFSKFAAKGVELFTQLRKADIR